MTYSPSPGTWVKVGRDGTVYLNGEPLAGTVVRDRHYRVGHQPHSCWRAQPDQGAALAPCFETQRDAAEALRRTVRLRSSRP